MIKNILLTLITTFISLLFVEVILRFFFVDYLYTGSKARSLYYSIPNLVLAEDNKSVQYAPNKPIRSIAVYSNQIEYDTYHHANNFGFLSDQNYTKENKKGIVFLGDSFTAGVGSTSPWIPKLDKKYSNINLYSFGVTGTGIWNFYNTLTKNIDKLNFDTIVVIAITDDFIRHQWYPIHHDHKLCFCTRGDTVHGCNRAQFIAKEIPLDLDASTLLDKDGMYLYKAYNIIKNKGKPQEKEKKKVAHCNIMNKNTMQKEKKKSISQMMSENLAQNNLYMKKIKDLADKLGEKVILIHIPEKREVQIKKYRMPIQSIADKYHITYYPLLTKYKFDLSMYHKHDGHPNDKGYTYLSSIVEEILKLKK